MPHHFFFFSFQSQSAPISICHFNVDDRNPFTIIENTVKSRGNNIENGNGKKSLHETFPFYNGVTVYNVYKDSSLPSII